MTPQPPTNNPPEKPSAEPLTEAECAQLTQERSEAQKLFQKLIEKDRSRCRFTMSAALRIGSSQPVVSAAASVCIRRLPGFKPFARLRDGGGGIRPARKPDASLFYPLKTSKNHKTAGSSKSSVWMI
jgi:hypothetical protein